MIFKLHGAEISTMTLQIPDQITEENVSSIAYSLRETFSRIYDKSRLDQAYFTYFNESESMQTNNFNRLAQRPLMAYFIAYALRATTDELKPLKAAFIEQAQKPLPGTEREFRVNVDAILVDVHKTVYGQIWEGQRNTDQATPALAA